MKKTLFIVDICRFYTLSRILRVVYSMIAYTLHGEKLKFILYKEKFKCEKNRPSVGRQPTAEEKENFQNARFMHIAKQWIFLTK
jgi:hypothetical protein